MSKQSADPNPVDPASTPSDTSQRPSVPINAYRSDMGTMDETAKDQTPPAEPESAKSSEVTTPPETEEPATPVPKKKTKCQKSKHKKKSKAVKKKSHDKKALRGDSDSDSSSDDESSMDEEDTDESSSSEEEVKKKKKLKLKLSKKAKEKKRRKSKKVESDSDSDEESDDSESSSDEETPRKRKKSAKKSKKPVESESEDVTSDADNIETQIQELMAKFAELKAAPKPPKTKRRRSSIKLTKSVKQKSKKDSQQYKRVDQLWDSSIHNYKLKESAKEEEGEFAEFAFLVRRRFDWENKYQSTVIDIKSKPLRAVLAEVMKDCKSVSLEAEEPTIDPNLLFLYLEDLRTYYKKTLKVKIKAEKKKKALKKLNQQRALCKMLVSYIDEDYAEIKKTLFPLLKAGNITFELLWALYRPNEIAITSCYGAWDEPRCFRTEYAMKWQTMGRGEWYCIEGKYLEYDGKGFGFGNFEVDIDSFKGPRKITSLASYPLKYHKDPEGVKKQIIKRGQSFIAMEGMEYKFHKGLAFMKKKKQVLKININGRVMVDPATFRRINPNYPISIIKPKDDLLSDDSDADDCSCCQDSDNDDAIGDEEAPLENDGSDDSPKFKYKWVEDDRGEPHYVAVEVDKDGQPLRSENLDAMDNTEAKKRTYSEEELLLTSPVVLGFAFSEKLWLEFSLSGIHPITYNEDAFDSLVLESDKKNTVRALVESHKYHAAKTIDDVVQGKGRGLVFALHGAPGTGKTLTAEGISELLRCPLYIVSAGELGTDPARLESELQKILDIAHSWGALLLLDEADVFLEKREVHDIHRNALVSIFLRLLEYFQGILFLTTNRVET